MAFLLRSLPSVIILSQRRLNINVHHLTLRVRTKAVSAQRMIAPACSCSVFYSLFNFKNMETIQNIQFRLGDNSEETLEVFFGGTNPDYHEEIVRHANALAKLFLIGDGRTPQQKWDDYKEEQTNTGKTNAVCTAKFGMSFLMVAWEEADLVEDVEDRICPVCPLLKNRPFVLVVTSGTDLSDLD